MGICFTINYVCGYSGIRSMKFINFRTPIYVCRYINFSMHIFFNYLTYIEAKREIETSPLCVSPFFMKEIKETILNFKYVTVIYQIQLLAYSQ